MLFARSAIAEIRNEFEKVSLNWWKIRYAWHWLLTGNLTTGANLRPSAARYSMNSGNFLAASRYFSFIVFFFLICSKNVAAAWLTLEKSFKKQIWLVFCQGIEEWTVVSCHFKLCIEEGRWRNCFNTLAKVYLFYLQATIMQYMTEFTFVVSGTSIRLRKSKWHSVRNSLTLSLKSIRSSLINWHNSHPFDSAGISRG